MKRFFCLLLCLCLFLPGCSGELMKNPVTFYYPRREYQYGAEDGVISSSGRLPATRMIFATFFPCT